ncbi:MAG: DUF1801 domain-containing protein [Pseudomonadota bacterium]
MDDLAKIDVPAMSSDVAAALSAWPKRGQTQAKQLRDLIYRTAGEIRAGPVTETLKWGQPSFNNGKAGTPLRLGYQIDEPHPVRLYVHCSTRLIDQCRTRFPNLVYERNRAVCLNDTGALPQEALRSCVALALTYHQRKTAENG